MTDLERLLAERECEALATRYTHALNLGSAADLAALFTSDGCLELLEGRVLRGRDAILRWGEERAARGVTTRHLRSNAIITITSDTTAEGLAYWTLFSLPAGADPVSFAGVKATGEWREQFVKTAEGWKLREKRVTLAMGWVGDRPAISPVR